MHLQSERTLQLHLDCATSMVIGLEWQPPFRMQALHYHVLRDGTLLGAVSEPYLADQHASAASNHRYTVLALDGTERVRAVGMIDVTASAEPRRATAPYCHSPTIHHAVWDWQHGYHAAPGSDLWSVTWGKDGNVYSFFGDGGGFGGDDWRGRASFGVARISGKPPLGAAQETNIYGGFAALYPSVVSGKSASIIAVGSDFYAIGGLYRREELGPSARGPVSGMPPHLEVLYSRHNAHSWRDGAWLFCSAPPGSQSDPTGPFCPVGFVNFGRGNAGAPGHYVYLFGVSNTASAQAAGAAARTYLARVPERRMLTRSAYSFFAGLTADAQPTWTTDPHRMVPIFTDPNPPAAGCGSTCAMAELLQEAVYDVGLRRYVGMAQGEHLAQTSFYEAQYLWGPWKTICYQNIDPGTGTGGWGNLGIAAGDSLGVHMVNAWTSADGLTMWMTFSSNGSAPKGARFPAAGTKMDSFNLISVRFR